MAVARVLGVLCSTLLMFACSPKGPEDKAPRRIPDLPSYDRSSCRDVQPFEGGEAPRGNHLANNYVAENAFNKPYDRADLEAVLNASAVQTSIYVMDMGVNVYRIPRSRGQCPMYYALPEVPSNLRSVWDEIAGGSGQGQLAGAYFEICEGNCPDYSMSNPTILVHESSDRWTLVHEMMHHNFNSLRKANHGTESINAIRERVRSGQINLESLVDSYDQNRSRQTLTAIANQVYSLINGIYVLLVNTTFEEIAIESLLLEEAANGNYTYISRDSTNSAIWYIKYSRQDGLRHFAAFSDVLLKIGREASRNEWRDINTIVERAQSDIDTVRAKTANILSRAETNAAKAQRRSNIRGRIVESLSEFTPYSFDMTANQFNPAQHAQVHERFGYETVEAVIDSLNNISNRFN
jgi:hypothetical protein